MTNKDITAKKGLAEIMKSQITSPRKAKKLQIAIRELDSLPSNALSNNHKVKKISDNIYSYKVDTSSRIVFGENENKRVLLDFIDTSNKEIRIKKTSSLALAKGSQRSGTKVNRH